MVSVFIIILTFYIVSNFANYCDPSWSNSRAANHYTLCSSTTWKLVGPDNGACCLEKITCDADCLTDRLGSSKIRSVDWINTCDTSKLKKVDDELVEQRVWNIGKVASKNIATALVTKGGDKNPFAGMVVETAFDVAFGYIDPEYEHTSTPYSLINDLRDEINGQLDKLKICMDNAISQVKTDVILNEINGAIKMTALCKGYKTLDLKYDCYNDLFETWHRELNVFRTKETDTLIYKNMFPVLKGVIKHYILSCEGQLEYLSNKYYAGLATLDDYEHVRGIILHDLNDINTWIGWALDAIAKSYYVPKNWDSTVCSGDEREGRVVASYRFGDPNVDQLQGIYNEHQFHIYTSQYVCAAEWQSECFHMRENKCKTMKWIGGQVVDGINHEIDTVWKPQFRKEFFKLFDNWRENIEERTKEYVICNDPRGDAKCLDYIKFDSETDVSGYFKVGSCKEGISTEENVPQWNVLAEGLAKFATGVKITPQTGDKPDFTVETHECSNPIVALNHGKELSYQLNVENGEFTGYADIYSWSGSTTVCARMQNSCQSSDGKAPHDFTDYFYQTCGNYGGLNIYPYRCEWDYRTPKGEDFDIYFRFPKHKDKICDGTGTGQFKSIEPAVVECGMTVTGYQAPQKSEDINGQLLFKLVTNTDYKEVYMEPCGSVYDTWVHVYDKNKNELHTNDDGSEHGEACSHSHRGDVGVPQTNNKVPADTYYFGLRGYKVDRHGEFKLEFICKQLPSWNYVVVFGVEMNGLVLIVWSILTIAVIVWGFWLCKSKYFGNKSIKYKPLSVLSSAGDESQTDTDVL